MKLVGKNGISAEMVQYSCDENNPENKIMTVNVKYGLIVHAEFLRHRMLSRGVKSNRAIPMSVIRKEVIEDPYVPVWFGSAQKGMVADKEVSNKFLARQLWLKARYLACGAHWLAEKIGAHKEWANRLLNPWQWVRETVTATEWDNLYNLRIHKDAQKDVREIVNLVYQLSTSCEPEPLKKGQLHVPYVKRVFNEQHDVTYVDNDGEVLTPEQAMKASAARCARSSYDKHDGTKVTLSSDIKLYNMLIESDPKHSSPVEHQGFPMELPYNEHWMIDGSNGWVDGVTHVDKAGNYWSGNFKGWIQHRQLLANHTCWDYKGDEFE